MIAYVLTFLAGMGFMVLLSGIFATLIMHGAKQIDRWEK
jgi:hypothetical protein